MGKDGRASKQVAVNKRARFEFEILERVEAGLRLTGTEVKTLRDGKVSLRGAYARFQGDELFLVDMDIPPYDRAGYASHDPKRTRKLLLHRREIKKLKQKLTEKGLTIIPLGVHFNSRGWAKVSLGVGRGKKTFDKRNVIKARDLDREMGRRLKRRR